MEKSVLRSPKQKGLTPTPILRPGFWGNFYLQDPFSPSGASEGFSGMESQDFGRFHKCLKVSKKIARSCHVGKSWLVQDGKKCFKKSQTKRFDHNTHITSRIFGATFTSKTRVRISISFQICAKDSEVGFWTSVVTCQNIFLNFWKISFIFIWKQCIPTEIPFWFFLPPAEILSVRSLPFQKTFRAYLALGKNCSQLYLIVPLTYPIVSYPLDQLYFLYLILKKNLSVAKLTVAYTFLLESYPVE